MSFVLDAQRRQAATASPEDAARAAFDATQRLNRRRALALGFTALMLILFAAAWWSLWPQQSAPPSVAQDGSGSATTVATSPPPQISPLVERRPTVTKSVPKRVVPPPVTQAPKTLSQTSADSRNTLVAFTYSSHIYGTHPDTRTVIVDGSKLVRGDSHKGWMLDEINETGVVWRKGAERVSVPILEMWED